MNGELSLKAEAKNAALRRAGELAPLWDLQLGDELPGATCSVVYEVWNSHGQDLALKVPFSYAEERDSWRVLEAFSGHGGVGVLRHDPESGAVLMPRLKPGQMLLDAEPDDEKALAICADLTLSLRQTPAVQAMTLERWFKELFDEPSNVLIDEARKVYLNLAESAPEPVLLHGDLHHLNILSNGDRWVAIDPKGILGDPAFELVAFMRNPVDRTPDASGMARRLRQFADLLGDPPDRLWGWALAETVLCDKQCSNEEFKTSWSAASQAIWEVRSEFLAT